jgi:hypothetical protein
MRSPTLVFTLSRSLIVKSWVSAGQTELNWNGTASGTRARECRCRALCRPAVVHRVHTRRGADATSGLRVSAAGTVCRGDDACGSVGRCHAASVHTTDVGAPSPPLAVASPHIVPILCPCRDLSRWVGKLPPPCAKPPIKTLSLFPAWAQHHRRPPLPLLPPVKSLLCLLPSCLTLRTSSLAPTRPSTSAHGLALFPFSLEFEQRRVRHRCLTGATSAKQPLPIDLW